MKIDGENLKKINEDRIQDSDIPEDWGNLNKFNFSNDSLCAYGTNNK